MPTRRINVKGVELLPLERAEDNSNPLHEIGRRGSVP